MSETSLLLNLGSGQRPFSPPWINVDCQARWNPDVVADCNDLSAHFADNTASMIVLHHVLEHFGCGEGQAMLRECHRILKPDGSLLVFVPDMRELAAMWQEGRIDTQIYMTSVYGAYMGDDADRHKWGFDRYSLRLELAAAGFHGTTIFHKRTIVGADIAYDRWILGVEATK